MRSFALKLALVFFTTLLIAMSAINARATYGAKISVDEPQYLLTALSLAEDFDLDISDELDEQRYLPFHELRLNQQTIDLNDSGQRISPHDPLLPLFLALPMGLGGWLASKIALAVLAAVTAVVTLWVAVRRFNVSTNIATAVVAVLFASPPMTSYATQIYPEMPAALALITSIAIITGNTTRKAVFALILALTALPWLSVKYVPVTAALAVYFLYKNWNSERKKTYFFSVVMGISAIAYLIIHKRIYGGWTVYASGDHFVNGEFEVVGRNPNLAARTRRLSGLLLDQQFGLIPWTPAFFALIPAFAFTVKERFKETFLLVLCAVVGWSVATWVALTMHGWWWPGRQLVVILPTAIIAMAILAEKFKAWRWFIYLGGISGVIAWLWLAFEATTDRRTLVVDFYETSYPIYQALADVLPDFTDFDQSALLSNGIWLTGIAVATILTITRKTKVQKGLPLIRYETRTQTLKIQGTKSKLKISKQVFEEH